MSGMLQTVSTHNQSRFSLCLSTVPMCKVDLPMWGQHGRALSFGVHHRWKRLYQCSPVIFCVLPWFVFLYVTKLLSFTVISWNGSQPISGAFFGGRVFFVLICFLFSSLTSLFPVWSWIPLVLFSSPGKFISVSFPCRNISLLLCHTDTGREDLPCRLGTALPLLPSLITGSSQQQSSGGKKLWWNQQWNKTWLQRRVLPCPLLPTASWVKWPVQYPTKNDLWVSVCIKPMLQHLHYCFPSYTLYRHLRYSTPWQLSSAPQPKDFGLFGFHSFPSKSESTSTRVS